MPLGNGFLVGTNASHEVVSRFDRSAVHSGMNELIRRTMASARDLDGERLRALEPITDERNVFNVKFAKTQMALRMFHWAVSARPGRISNPCMILEFGSLRVLGASAIPVAAVLVLAFSAPPRLVAAKLHPTEQGLAEVAEEAVPLSEPKILVRRTIARLLAEIGKERDVCRNPA